MLLTRRLLATSGVTRSLFTPHATPKVFFSQSRNLASRRLTSFVDGVGARGNLLVRQTYRTPRTNAFRQITRAMSKAVKQEPEVDRVKQAMSYLTMPHLRMYGIIGGVGLGIYGIVTTGLRTASFFSGISMWDTGKVGFMAGCLCGGAIVFMCSFVVRRFWSLRPDTVYWKMLKHAQRDPKVLARVGADPQPLSDFRAYTFVPGGLRTNATERAKYTSFIAKWYKPHRLQMMFTVKGSKGTGMLSAEVEATSTMSDFTYVHLALDMLDGDEGKLVLQGREDKIVYSGQTSLR